MTSLTGGTGAMSPNNSTMGMKEKIPSGYKKGTVQTYPPEFMELLKHLMGQLGPESYLSRLAGGEEGLFNEIEAPAMRQFAGLQGNLASRFSGMGTGARKSSGFQNTMNQATSDFAQDLQSKRQEMQMNAIKEMLGMGSSLLSNNNPYQTTLVPKNREPSGWEKFMQSIGSGAGNLATGWFGKQLGLF